MSASYADIARERANALGTYLQARRARVSPQQAGLPARGRRRVPGLRREEVAMLANISLDYYLRLERGRDRNPSQEVLESIARVLLLDEEHLAHLRSLTGQEPRSRPRPPRNEAPPAGTLSLLEALPQPAFIEDRSFDIVASNAKARALSPRLAEGRNQLEDIFLDPHEVPLYPDWDVVTGCLVAGVRQAAAHALDEPRLGELIAELIRKSPRFRELWGQHDVRSQRGAALRIDHPQVGEMTLHRERLAVTGTEGLTLVVLHADPSSDDADKLARLDSALVRTA
ncbi:helix-turn-helix domain-containing protein [Nesterenkonia haasae]|uniref:helix-turn-helix domain-containing protein n=1 Tax=Nesterenkonia haasae TaxID=2587813 RepID=UPI001F48AE9C|nr:helix-turn-helix transcriptional regulator [Nesterenkonia haasae]